jgi:branched-chain amino acid transport system substrate-binding protein
VFELHPENKSPHDVLLSLLGSFEYERKYPEGASAQQPNTSAGSMLFKETGKRLGGRFLQYWRQNGGLAQQGFPISDEFEEKSDLDGKTYRVQYFERAVFEYHPENRPPHDVLLSQLGTFQFRRAYPNGEPSSESSSATTIRIVSSLPRTGLSKTQTDDVVAGMRMALEEHNGRAGDFTIDYQDWDDATAASGRWDAAKEAANAEKAVGDPDVMVYLGTFNSGAAAVSIPILNKAGIAMISPGNTYPGLTKRSWDATVYESLYNNGPRNYFRVTTADDVQSVAAAHWAMELGFKKVYVVNDQEDYGKGTARVFEQQFRDIGGTVLANESYDPSRATFRTLANKIKDAGADLVYCGCLMDTGGPQIIKDLKAVAPDIQFMGPDGIAFQSFVDAAGTRVTEGALGTIAGRDYLDLPPKGVQFYNKFKTTHRREPDPYAVYGYEAMNVALDAIARAGKKDRAAILDAIRNTRNFEGALGTWSFDENGDITPNYIGLYKVRRGEWEFQKYMTIPR